MDQLAALLGRASHALLIVAGRWLPSRSPPDAGGARGRLGPWTLADSAAERPAAAGACPSASRRAARRGRNGPPCAPEPTGLSSPDARAGDVGSARCCWQSPLRDDYEVSTPQLDLAVDSSSASRGIGARLTGAGFGGCVVGLVPADCRGGREPHGRRHRPDPPDAEALSAGRSTAPARSPGRRGRRLPADRPARPPGRTARSSSRSHASAPWSAATPGGACCSGCTSVAVHEAGRSVAGGRRRPPHLGSGSGPPSRCRGARLSSPRTTASTGWRASSAGLAPRRCGPAARRLPQAPCVSNSAQPPTTSPTCG
jgi:hypothetical protein